MANRMEASLYDKRDYTSIKSKIKEKKEELKKLEKKIAKKDPYQDMACANHAHNYYLEILSEAGIIGISLMIIFFLILLKDCFNYLKKYNQQKKSRGEFINTGYHLIFS